VGISASVGKLIKKFRKERGLTIEELAGKVNISKTYLSLIENQARNINIRRIDEIAAALGVPVNALLQEGAETEETSVESEEFLEVIPAGGSPENRIRIQMVELGEIYVGRGGRKRIIYRKIPLINPASEADPGIFYSGDMPEGLVEREIDCPPEIDDLTAFALRAEDAAMRPRIEKGDFLIACPSWKIKDNCPAVVKIKTERATCRILNALDDSYVLTALNRDYPPVIIKKSDVLWAYPVARLVADLY
jgi:transcriptional regulator with XRE-family HTH domain